MKFIVEPGTAGRVGTQNLARSVVGEREPTPWAQLKIDLRKHLWIGWWFVAMFGIGMLSKRFF